MYRVIKNFVPQCYNVTFTYFMESFDKLITNFHCFSLFQVSLQS